MFNDSGDHLTAYASVRSQGGVSVFDPNATISSETIEQFLSTERDTRVAVDKLQGSGFQVERVGPLSVQISGPAELFMDRMGVRFTPLGLIGEDWTSRLLWPILAPTPETSGNLLDTGIPEVEGIAFPDPIRLATAMSEPPELDYHHLRVPEDLTRILNADPVHNEGFHGQNVRAAIIDSGFQWSSHPYFTSKVYDVEVSSLPYSGLDIMGHGTGESANLLAVAPRIKLYGLGLFRNPSISTIQEARDTLGVQIISCSWEPWWVTDGPEGVFREGDRLLEAEITLCVAEGIIVLFAAGNLGSRSFTASMPDTISVGGVYVDEGGDMLASNYANSFDSTIYPNQHVPEVCGLVGTKPYGAYIALPVPPNCIYDEALADLDKTKADDGWAVFSGTSAACPQVAGAVALILSKYPGADSEEVRERLHRCQDITRGQSYMGDSAGPGYDAATGYGLVDVERACE